MVDSAQRRVVRLRSIEIFGQSDAEPAGMEHWRAASVPMFLDTVEAHVRFSVRDANPGVSWVDLKFPTRVHERVCGFLGSTGFNPAAKADLLHLFVAVAKAIGADGFGYRMAEEDSLYAPLTIEDLRKYIEIGNGWFENELQLLVAGLRVQCVDDANFEYDRSDRPLHYRQSGFYIYDLLWPQ